MLAFTSELSVLLNKSGFSVLAKSDAELGIEREIKNNTVWLKIKNNSKRSTNLYSAILVDITLPNNLLPKEVLEHGWLSCSEVKYKTLDQSTKQKSVLFRRDQNPFSFKKEYGYLPDSIVSEWFSVLRSVEHSLVVGAVTTSNKFCVIYVKKERYGARLKVVCQFDGISLGPGKTVKTEKVALIIGNEEDSLAKFAKAVARHMKIKNIKPQIKAMCNSYYWNANVVDEKIINNELDAIEDLGLNLEYFQIDAGYTKHFGDWLDYKERFPNGFGEIVERIKSLGMKPGIWIAPFTVDPNTKFAKIHKSWLMQGLDKYKHFDGRFTSPADSLIPDLDLHVIDPTNKNFQKYLKKVIKHFIDLGFEMFKIDFTYPICLTNKFSHNVTRVQAIREGIKAIRKQAGPDVHLVSAISPLSPLVGLVDSARVGIDTLNPFVCAIPKLNSLINNSMIQDNLNENKLRKFLHNIVWQNDPDCLVFRKGTGINNNLIVQHRKFVKENKMSMWIGDSIAKMTKKEKQKLLKYFNSVK